MRGGCLRGVYVISPHPTVTTCPSEFGMASVFQSGCTLRANLTCVAHCIGGWTAKHDANLHVTCKSNGHWSQTFEDICEKEGNTRTPSITTPKVSRTTTPTITSPITPLSTPLVRVTTPVLKPVTAPIVYCPRLALSDHAQWESANCSKIVSTSII